MRVSVLGLGYVGSVSAACLAARGHRVVGVDIEPAKVEMINRGTSPVVEELIGDLTAQVVREGALRATTSFEEALQDSEITLVCVGTPSAANGSVFTGYLERVAEQIGEVLGKAAGSGPAGRHTVVFRSTMPPGTCEGLLVPILERSSGLRVGPELGVAVNPEFLREGSSVRDFADPPMTVIGEFDESAGEALVELYDGLPGEVFRVPVAVAEMTKYAGNAFHGLKIGFANEIGAICRALGIDSHEVMDLLLADRKLNVSPAYLRPGFAFGGSCLPKDLRGLVHTARRADVEVPILEHVLPSNEVHLRRALDLVTSFDRRRIGLFGLAFKTGTDDLRESPMVELAERLLGKGYELRVYDSGVALSRLTGANRTYVETRLPHLGRLLVDSVDDVLAHAEVCVVGTTDPAVRAGLAGAGERIVVDLVHLPDAAERRTHAGYSGLAW
jgi:GDP-mannose 6-dehydrogenase